jgi:hypothetical protein
MEPRRASALALGFSLAGVLLIVLLIGVAAGIGPSGLVHGTPHDSIFHAPPPPTPSSSATTPAAPQGNGQLPHGQSDIPGAAVIGTILRIALALWLLSLIWRGLRWLAEELAARRSRDPVPVVVDFDVLDDPTPLVEEMRRDADAQLELLLGGTPRNAIVACWERFEEQAERVGLARRPWETSSEFTLRVLDVVSADAAAVSRLAALYREARFSEHEITEDNRQQALEALDRVRSTIGRDRTAMR